MQLPPGHLSFNRNPAADPPEGCFFSSGMADEK
jgi:hypothetical protein